MRYEREDPRLFEPQCHDLLPVKVLHKNPWFQVLSRGAYYTMEYNSLQVVVLPIVDNHSVILVKVKRPLLADSPIELPAGAANKDESLFEAAARELNEETGIMVHDISRFISIEPLSILPNRSPLLSSIFLVNLKYCEFEQRLTHDDEVEDVLLLDYNKVRSLLQDGNIYITMTVAVLSRFLLSI